jgi:hypothetical protein
MVSIADLADREPRGLADGESVNLGRRTVTWMDTPHLPHGWECGYLFDKRTGTSSAVTCSVREETRCRR